MKTTNNTAADKLPKNIQMAIAAELKQLKQELTAYINAMAVLSVLNPNKIKYFEGPVAKQFEKEIREEQIFEWDTDTNNNIEAYRAYIKYKIKNEMEGKGLLPGKATKKQALRLAKIGLHKPTGRKIFHPEKFMHIVEDETE